MSDFINKELYDYKIINGAIIYGPIFNQQGERIRSWELIINLYVNKKEIPIKDEYILFTKDGLESQIAINHNTGKYYTSLYTINGLIDGKQTKSEPTIITVGKNLGKINETTIITQALIHGRTHYLKKLNSGYYKDKPNQKIPFPMAVNTYDKYKHKIEYPCYIQPKLDGIRLLSFLNKTQIDLRTRRLKEITGFDNVKNELKILIKDLPNLFIDGELYKHGMKLQQISGIVRNTKVNTNETELKYHIFDCFDVTKNLIFKERINILKTLFSKNKFKYLVLLETKEIKNEKQGDNYFYKYIEKKYEGIIYKNINALYEYAYNKEKRSLLYLKRKNVFDSEFKIVDFTEGENGSNKGAVVFILETKEGKKFNAVPNWTLTERKNTYDDCLKNFKTKYKNKFATIKYDDLSEDDVPLRAKFIVIRID